MIWRNEKQHTVSPRRKRMQPQEFLRERGESIEGRIGMALLQLPKINMMAPVCGVTCLQRHLSYWIPDGYTAGPGVINLASCVGSASM